MQIVMNGQPDGKYIDNLDTLIIIVVYRQQLSWVMQGWSKVQSIVPQTNVHSSNQK